MLLVTESIDKIEITGIDNEYKAILLIGNSTKIIHGIIVEQYGKRRTISFSDIDNMKRMFQEDIT